MHRIARAFPYFFRDVADKGFLLVLATICAFICANTDIANFYNKLLHAEITFVLGASNLVIPLHVVINDILMSLFFFVVGVEIRKEMTSGHLATKAQRILPLISATCGFIAPMVIFFILNHNNSAAIRGWGVPTATDIAFTLAIISMFSSKIPTSIKVFITALAIIDDLMAVVVIALFYTETLYGIYVVGTVICVAILLLMNHRQVHQLTPYVLIGIIMWVLIFASGIHATIAGVVLGLLMPYDVEKDDSKVAVSKALKSVIQPLCTYFIMPIFAFFNAGVSVMNLEADHIFNNVMLGTALGLFLGKQIGIFGSFYIAIKTGLAQMPEKANYLIAYGGSVMCGIGFTMSLFIGALAFDLGTMELTSAKVGVLVGSLISCLYGIIIFTFMKKQC